MSDELHPMGRTRDHRWAALLRAANAGDRASYVAFLTDVSPVLRGIIAARCGRHKEDCEDILQTVLIAIHEKRHTWRDPDPVSAWAYAIARYKTVDAMRHAGRRPTVSYDGTEEQISDDSVQDPTVVGDLDTLLGQLDDVSASIVRQIKIEGHSAEEVGRKFDMTPGAVRVVLHRAMARARPGSAVVFTGERNAVAFLHVLRCGTRGSGASAKEGKGEGRRFGGHGLISSHSLGTPLVTDAGQFADQGASVTALASW